MKDMVIRMHWKAYSQQLLPESLTSRAEAVAGEEVVQASINLGS